MRRYGVSETKNIIPDGERHGVLVCGVLRCDACDFFSDKESPGGQTRRACLMDCWFEDKIQSGEEWSAGLRTGYFFFCEMPFGANMACAILG